jgi:hypothetical protein
MDDEATPTLAPVRASALTSKETLSSASPGEIRDTIAGCAPRAGPIEVAGASDQRAGRQGEIARSAAIVASWARRQALTSTAPIEIVDRRRRRRPHRADTCFVETATVRWRAESSPSRMPTGRRCAPPRAGAKRRSCRERQRLVADLRRSRSQRDEVGSRRPRRRTPPADVTVTDSGPTHSRRVRSSSNMALTGAGVRSFGPVDLRKPRATG